MGHGHNSVVAGLLNPVRLVARSNDPVLFDQVVGVYREIWERTEAVDPTCFYRTLRKWDAMVKGS